MSDTNSQQGPHKYKLDNQSKGLLGWGLFFLVVFAVLIALLPLAVTKWSWVSLGILKPNEIGDTLGGIMGPAVGVLGVGLTFLAFWAQYAANKEQRRQFDDTLKGQERDRKLQQFESQFYEMLRLHKENVNEMEFQLQNEDVLKGRSVFEFMNVLFTEYLSALSTIENTLLTQKGYNYCYEIFFWGLDNYRKSHNINIAYIIAPSESDTLMIRIYGRINAVRLVGADTLAGGDIGKGFAGYLGHYFRHLFLMVKFVAESPIVLQYEEKMRYLKVLRAQLSNYEQIMLFYNWLADGYGSEWETDDNQRSNNNHFLTKYKMIHNLWVNEVYQNPFFSDHVNGLIKKYNKNRDKYSENPNRTPLFEFQVTNFEKEMTLNS